MWWLGRTRTKTDNRTVQKIPLLEAVGAGTGPAPEFYYKQGGGPLFDMGPYYLTALVNLLGPIGLAEAQ